MARPIRVFDGIFGRLQLVEVAAGAAPQTGTAPQIVAKQSGADVDFLVDGESLRLTRDNLLFFNPGVASQAQIEPGGASVQLVAFQASGDWLCGRFPAVF